MNGTPNNPQPESSNEWAAYLKSQRDADAEAQMKSEDMVEEREMMKYKVGDKFYSENQMHICVVTGHDIDRKDFPYQVVWDNHHVTNESEACLDGLRRLPDDEQYTGEMMTDKFEDTTIRPYITDAEAYLIKGDFAASLAASTLAQTMMQFNQTQDMKYFSATLEATDELEVERRRSLSEYITLRTANGACKLTTAA